MLDLARIGQGLVADERPLLSAPHLSRVICGIAIVFVPFCHAYDLISFLLAGCKDQER